MYFIKYVDNNIKIRLYHMTFVDITSMIFVNFCYISIFNEKISHISYF